MKSYMRDIRKGLINVAPEPVTAGPHHHKSTWSYWDLIEAPTRGGGFCFVPDQVKKMTADELAASSWPCINCDGRTLYFFIGRVDGGYKAMRDTKRVYYPREHIKNMR